MSDLFNDQDLLAISNDISDFALLSGGILNQYFKTPGISSKDLDVKFKDKNRSDPVTLADTESQNALKEAIFSKYPNHNIVGEEDEKNDSDITNHVWVIDPLDGTRNFLNGLPIYASSIGLLSDGVPVAGALYIPWPNSEGYLVISAVKGIGITINNNSYIAPIQSEFNASGIVTLPGSFDRRFKFSKDFRDNSGELRIGGSIAYELALLVLGVSQYAVISSSHIWDVAGAIPILFEAGYEIRTIPAKKRINSWIPFESFSHLSDKPKYENYRTRINPILVSPKDQIDYIANNIKIKKPSLLELMKSFVK